MYTKISPEAIIKLLNSFIALDPKAMQELLNVRIDCSYGLAKHPGFQGARKPKNLNQNQIFFLGLINSLFGTLQDREYGPISVVYDKEGHLTGFCITDTNCPAFRNPECSIELSCHQG